MIVRALFTATVLLTSPVLAQPVAVSPMPCTLPTTRAAPFLSREQQAAFRLEVQEQTKGMSPSELRIWQQKQVCDVVGMSEAEKAALRNRLQTEWDALAPAEQAALLRPGIPVSQRPQNQR